MGTPGQFRIEEIRAIKACITSEGFAYLGDLIISFMFQINICIFSLRWTN